MKSSQQDCLLQLAHWTGTL